MFLLDRRVGLSDAPKRYTPGTIDARWPIRCCVAGRHNVVRNGVEASQHAINFRIKLFAFVGKLAAIGRGFSQWAPDLVTTRVELVVQPRHPVLWVRIS